MGLFGGKTDTQPSSTATPAVRPQTTVSGRATMEAPTIIGQDSTVKGELESRTDMLIEGRVEGKVKGAKRIIIGANGNVEAQVHAESIVVRGTVNGDLEGSQKVEITSTGKVFGNITSKAIVVAEGATFRGSSKMAHTTPAPATNTPKPSLSSTGSQPATSSASSSTSKSTSTSKPTSTSASTPN